MKESNQGNKQEFRESNKPQKDLSTRLAKGVLFLGNEKIIGKSKS